MAEVDEMIRREIEGDPTINVKALTVAIRHKGAIPRRHFLHVGGIAQTEHDKNQVERIARHHTGDAYTVISEVTIREREDA